MRSRDMLRLAGLALTVSSSSGLAATALSPQLRGTASRAASMPFLRVAAAGPRMDEAPTLEEELMAGRITQEEYDELSTAMTEEEYQAELDSGILDDEPLSADAAKIMSGMRSESGVEFAPWMKIDAEAIAQAKKEREARKSKVAPLKADAMLIDPQAAELGAGGGLKSEVLSQEEVELRWDTSDEAGNAGFIVQRRRGGAANFEDLAEFSKFSPLRTKGPAGGSYVYLDDTADVGTWVYRILDCDTKGTRSALCQKLVEIESKDEQQFTLIVGGAIAALAIVLVLAGILSDPIQTTSKGAALF